MTTTTLTTGRPMPLGPVKRCPRCATVLDGGPVLFHCQSCKRAVYAADLDNEIPTTLGRAA
ncbi:hypothetical protein [Nonomuraea roseoviolacea]|uniref:Uncharacterized protein n=1 Tax=Nonomuraea roseoviolacea subsp. carminata TaxID=160689 RepID=A0ABT1JS18_9ACTN|nr:hypothetical protein [Nonomuraea roseoviolacea]MCP2344535.1 hypothetical protein [Nonomuraea roseoviolacea subsp. carminata]